VKAGKVKVDLFSDTDAQQMKSTIGAEIQKEWVAVANKAGYDGPALLKEFIALAAKYDGKSNYVTGFERVKKLSQ